MSRRVPIPEGGIALDADHYYTLYVAYHEDDQPVGPPVGALVYHRMEDGSWCGGSIKWAGPTSQYDQARWDLVSLDPLDVNPSIKCGTCAEKYGDNGISHGFIHGGKWEPAGAIPDWVSKLDSTKSLAQFLYDSVHAQDGAE
jgi:hypothetical protein